MKKCENCGHDSLRNFTVFTGDFQGSCHPCFLVQCNTCGLIVGALGDEFEAEDYWDTVMDALKLYGERE